MQGALAPVAASVVLFGSFLLIQWLPKLTLQTVFNSYFFLLGTFAVSGGVKAPLRAAVTGPCHLLSTLAVPGCTRPEHRPGVQSGRLAQPLLRFKLPEGWAVDQQVSAQSWAMVHSSRAQPSAQGLLAPCQGNSIRTTSVSSLDLLTLGLGLTVATLDLLSLHQNFTLNNAVACLIVADILQVCCTCTRAEHATTAQLCLGATMRS